MKIVRYLNTEFFINIALVAIGLVFLFAFFDFLQEIGNLNSGKYDLAKIIVFITLSMPGHLYEIIPLACLIGSMFTIGQLSSNSEIVVMRTSGMSIFKIASSLLFVSILFSFITFFVGNLITPVSEKNAQQIRINSTDGTVSTDFRSGVWMKDGNNFVNIENVLPDASLKDIHIYEFDKNFSLRSIVDAENGKYSNGLWELENIQQSFIKEDGFEVTSIPSGTWKSMIKPEMMNVLLISPDRMSIFDLNDFINYLEKNNQKTSRYEVSFWEKIIQPAMPIIMIMFAVPFGFFQERSGGKYLKMFLGIIFGIIYQIMNSMFRHIGILNDWEPLATAIIPSLIILSLAIFLMVYFER
jgi:lipopolysaccharide export system permease protein